MLLSFKLLLRKGSAAGSIVALALLVAMLASANSIVGFLTFQTEVLGGLVNPGETILVLSGNATSLTDSSLNKHITDSLAALPCVKSVSPQKLMWVNLTAGSETFQLLARGVENVSSYLKSQRAYINGTAAVNPAEACVGEIAARAIAIKVGETLGIAYKDREVTVKAVGMFRTETELDSEIVVPMEAVHRLTGENETVSIIQVSLREGVNVEEALNEIAELLPKEAKALQTQQLKAFTQQINLQVLGYLNVWSLTIYIAVAAASYVIATRLIAESGYELAMLKALGASNRRILTLIITYTGAVALLGSVLGVSLGLAGTQAASTILRWLKASAQVSPMLEPTQAIQIVLLTLTSALLGCVYPACKASKTCYAEKML